MTDTGLISKINSSYNSISNNNKTTTNSPIKTWTEKKMDRRPE